MDKEASRKVASILFFASTLISTYFYAAIDFTNLLALSGGLFTASITAGIWLEVSYRYLIKEATAPLDKLVDKL